MIRMRYLLWIVVLILLAACGKPEPVQHEFSYYEINFDELVPAGIDPQQCWNGMGMDEQGRVMIGLTSQRNDGREDFIVFRYTPASGKREYLGSFIDILVEAGNYAEGENVPKGHTRMISVDGSMYMASQGFHDFKQEIDDLPNFRGSHIFAFDTTTDTWKDLSAALPGGVIAEHQGIVGLNYLPERHLLIGITHPYSDIVLYDYQTEELFDVIPGIPWALGNPLSREVVVAPSGNIYTYRGTEDPIDRYETFPVWKYSAEEGTMEPTSTEMRNGFWIGQASTADGSLTYVPTVNGQLYAFDTAAETFTDLGYMLPIDEYEEGTEIVYQYGVTLSPDESRLYYVLMTSRPEASGRLYQYNIESGKFSFVQQLPAGVYTSQNLRDDENIYLAHFGTERNVWSGNVRLMVIDVTP